MSHTFTDDTETIFNLTLRPKLCRKSCCSYFSETLVMIVGFTFQLMSKVVVLET